MRTKFRNAHSLRGKAGYIFNNDLTAIYANAGIAGSIVKSTLFAVVILQLFVIHNLII